MMRYGPIFLMAGLLYLSPSEVRAVDNCVQNNLKSLIDDFATPQPIAVKEVVLTIDGFPVTRILPANPKDPRLKELVDFMSDNKVVMTKGFAPNTGGKTTFIRIPEDALVSEQALALHLEGALVDYFAVPLNRNKLPEQSRKLVEQMQTKYATRFINEPYEAHGRSYTLHNMIGIRTRHTDNLRVNGVVVHEITHNTTDRKLLEALNPQLVQGKRAPQALTPTISGRSMNFKAKSGKDMKGVDPTYRKEYDSDEIEAHIRELGQSNKDALEPEYILKQINSFIDAQEAQLQTLLKNDGKDLVVTTGEINEKLLSGRRQQRLVTSNDVDFDLTIIVPKSLTSVEELKFIKDTLNDRLKWIRSYRSGLEKRYPKKNEFDFSNIK